MKQVYLRSLIGFISCIALSGYAQTPLPHGLTDFEKTQLSQFDFRQATLSPAPEMPVRAAAEWEEVEFLVVTWEPAFQNILRQIVAVGVTECKVIITTQNQTAVSSYLTSNGIPLTNIIFMNAPWNSIWIRDYAGNTVYANDIEQRALTDWIYNRPRPNDNIMPSAHAAQVGIPIYITNTGVNDLVNTGGNYMSDGLGNAFASNLILEENASGNPYGVSIKTEAQIDQIMHDYMGINQFIKMPTLPYDEIHHIDMHMKLLDEQTLLVSKYPSGVADGPQIEANINYVTSNFVTPFGTPYKVEWIDAPPSTGGTYPDTGAAYRTYSNSVIVNKSILVPVYRPEVDATALAKYQALMPGYNVVGIDVDNPGENLINQLGAIHCITHTIGVADPLWIVHKPVEEANAGQTIAINATIKHQSGIASAKVYWRTAGDSPFSELPMILLDDDVWTADLAIPNLGVDIQYYIGSTAISGKTLTRPLPAPAGYWTIDVQNLSAQAWAQSHVAGPFPNPARESVNFQFGQAGMLDVTITNTIGQILSEQTIANANGVFTLDLNPGWRGTLFVTFKGDFGQVTRKLVKL